MHRVWGMRSITVSYSCFDEAVEWLVIIYSDVCGVKFLSLCAVVYLSHRLPGTLYADSSILLPLLEW